MDKRTPAAIPTSCVIVIGNEILSGRTKDQNIAFIGGRCDELGIRLAEARVVPDVEDEIIAAIDACRKQYSYIFTTGGIGPTHDDITAAAVARLFNTPLVRNTAAVAAMNKYYEPGKLNEARLKMADIPAGAALIDNPVSGAPGFQLENVFVLPGVPMIMQAMFDGITDRLTGGVPILTETVVTGLTEGVIAPGLEQIQADHPRLTIGSYPYFRNGKLGVNIVIRTTDRGELNRVVGEISKLLQHLGDK